MLKINVVDGSFEVPRIIFTLRGNKNSEQIVALLQEEEQAGQQYTVFETPEDIQAYFTEIGSPAHAVVLFDFPRGEKYFSMCTVSRPENSRSMPRWSGGAQWGVQIHTDRALCRCVRQLRSDFLKNFLNRLKDQGYPWGPPRQGEHAPKTVALPETTPATIERLNQGPDIARSIAHMEYALELPQGSRISWIRVAPEPIICDTAYINRITDAIRQFEQATQAILDDQTLPPTTRTMIESRLLDGVELKDSELARHYLHPLVQSFSVDRADLHYTGKGLFASEIDEMPGGFGELAHIDYAYNVNQERWNRCYEKLTEDGLLLFVVSSEWSSVYVTEISWLVEHMRSLGFNAGMVESNDLEETLVHSENAVLYKKERVGTIWRLFPVFETEGHLAKLVLAAHERKIRMIPEFAHYGNKAWFALFREWNSLFTPYFEEETYQLLCEVLPDSHLVNDVQSFPFFVGKYYIDSFYELCNLSPAVRDNLVLKICGANKLASRSYGVLMGHGLSSTTWTTWIMERIENKQPFVVQQKIETGIARMPVRNTKRNCAELFNCRILIRPWVVLGEIVSASCIAVPSDSLRVHGRVDMAVAPVVFG